MPILIKHFLSGSDRGRPITVSATAAAGAIELHTVTASATGVLELLTIWGSHSATAETTTTVAVVGVTNGSIGADYHQKLSSQTISSTVPRLIFNQLPLSGTDTFVHCYSTATETFHIWGHVDRIATG